MSERPARKGSLHSGFRSDEHVQQRTGSPSLMNKASNKTGTNKLRLAIVIEESHEALVTK
ncbi:hypothetical protein EGM85_11380 [Macrococcus caseolyticus]|nr:hypothetical protein [Macrococcus caseolyticus]RKO11679.1 hypothetical protein D6861_11380 [Macrococcus caseolyticus]